MGERCVSSAPRSFLQAPESSDWLLSTIPWLLGLCAVAAGATAAGVWLLHTRLRELARLAERLSALEPIQTTLARVAREREDLDLRRIEHVLIEIRDGQRRLEDSLLRAAQVAHHGELARGLPASDGAGLSERIVQRLIAHGYEHVQVVPTLEELAKLFEAEFEALSDVDVSTRLASWSAHASTDESSD